MSAAASKKIALPAAVIDAVLCQNRVDEPPHDFYKYPARFSPAFAREIIREFSNEGEVVLDPFCGSGTTLLEAMSHGRRAAGMDVSTLATFVARTKTTPLSVHDRRAIEQWCDEVAVKTSFTCDGRGRLPEEDREHYERNLPAEVREFFSWVITRIARLDKSRQQAFVRLILLSVGQWALDCKTSTPNKTALRDELVTRLREAIGNYMQFLSGTAELNGLARCRLGGLRRIINRDARAIHADGRIPRSWLPAKLVVTSPPYPGVHVVYHRWQINGRKETPAPFWLANQRDGAGEAFYALGRRDEPGLGTYFDRLKEVFASVRSLLSDDAQVFQLVAFSNPTWQLPAFLEAMEEAGFAETLVQANHECVVGGRVWRQVPGRRWYVDGRRTGKSPGGNCRQLQDSSSPILCIIEATGSESFN
jgi:DNA modification methylase